MYLISSVSNAMKTFLSLKDSRVHCAAVNISGDHIASFIFLGYILSYHFWYDASGIEIQTIVRIFPSCAESQWNAISGNPCTFFSEQQSRFSKCCWKYFCESQLFSSKTAHHAEKCAFLKKHHGEEWLVDWWRKCGRNRLYRIYLW